MRAVVQRVSQASVSVEGEVLGQIGPGLLVLLAAGEGDDDAAQTYTLDKILNLRIFRDEDGRMNRSLLEVQGALLIISQFTLYGDVRKGRRPSFIKAMHPTQASPRVDAFVAAAKARGVTQVATGRFGADMQVALVNDGPVTILIDSARDF